MAVHRLALERDEQIALDHIAAVDLDAGDLEIAAGDAAHCFGDGGGVPEREREPVARFDPPRPEPL